jgi:hypothetical protein
MTYIGHDQRSLRMHKATKQNQTGPAPFEYLIMHMGQATQAPLVSTKWFIQLINNGSALLTQYLE